MDWKEQFVGILTVHIVISTCTDTTIFTFIDAHFYYDLVNVLRGSLKAYEFCVDMYIRIYECISTLSKKFHRDPIIGIGNGIRLWNEEKSNKIRKISLKFCHSFTYVGKKPECFCWVYFSQWERNFPTSKIRM